MAYEQVILSSLLYCYSQAAESRVRLEHVLIIVTSNSCRQFISFFILTLSNCGTIFVMGVLIMQELYFAHFQGGYSVYSVPHNLFEINVLHGIINSHQLI